ncbi:outer membrane protein assembly factor BamA [Granulicella sp. 5B5]|uniref:outer membrane protein assembly factor BamA n=1 Tax=Granulicella sp. 5B5 TaxID=1617967 RepID=UPI0015F6B81F|nr:outer membrane protein assembly factor BamA [Granulicella sp. 5B5]QMV20283.1 outer membrane protein assembly factor BamA [Granulicella sp. 5B5]
MRVSASSLNSKIQPCKTQSVPACASDSDRQRPGQRAGLRRIGVGATLGAALLFAAVPGFSTSVEAQSSAPIKAPQRFSADQAPQPLCQPQVIGNRRIPKESILARLFSRPGDPYDPAVVERDFNSLWNTGYFDDVRIERIDTPACVQLEIYVREKPTIREINYKGLNAVSVSDVLDRFKKEKVGLTVESQYDPTKVKRAEVVLQEMLGEHGHQFATIKTEIKTIPPAAVSLTFNVKEGPTVKVGKIAFDGNKALNHRELVEAMKNLKPIGIPHSIILENIFPRTFDASKLDEDAERVRQAYRDKGYFKAITGEPQTNVRNAGGINPLTLHPSTGKRVDILIPVEEGERYRLGGITFSGNKAYSNSKALRAQFAVKDGEYFNATLFGKGLEALRKAYGEGGYINMVGTPTPRVDEAKKLVYLNVDIDEGKPFYISRIEFTGNTITRDKVIRRELLVEEGQVYNSRLVDLSLLRLNQLNYFDTLKSDTDVETRQNADNNTVDLLIKLHEKGKNSIGLNGGISGLSGSFLGTNYETNNFLGLGETLSVNANIGDLSRNLSLGFTEPYLRNKPVSLGVQVFDSKFDYNPAKSYAIANGQSANLTNAQNSLLNNYNQSTKGVTLSTSTALRKLFRRSGVARVGISYSLSRSGITTFNQNTLNVFQTLAFRSGVAGQDQLNGIVTSMITPSFSFSTLDRAVGPHNGKDFNVAVQIAGAGGNTKYYAPSVSFRQFFPMKGLKVSREGHNVLGYRLLFSTIGGYGGEVAPPFARIYSGGENEVRGFDIRSSSPYTFIPTKVNFNLTNPDGSPVPRDPTNPALGNVTIPLPIYRLSAVGGDTNFTANLEYRIPIVNQVTFALFTDFGMDFDLQSAQLRQSVQGVSTLNSPLYGCPTIINGACFGGQSVKFPLYLNTVPGSNYVPRMSNGGELQVVLPIVNAPLRLYYAYNPLRLYKSLPQQLALPIYCSAGSTACFRNLFPNSEAGLYSFQQAVQFYGADYLLREPRKTFRLTVSTTF